MLWLCHTFTCTCNTRWPVSVPRRHEREKGFVSGRRTNCCRRFNHFFLHAKAKTAVAGPKMMAKKHLVTAAAAARSGQMTTLRLFRLELLLVVHNKCCCNNNSNTPIYAKNRLHTLCTPADDGQSKIIRRRTNISMPSGEITRGSVVAVAKNRQKTARAKGGNSHRAY